MLLLVVGLVIFFLPHSISIFAPHWRDVTVQRFGEHVWKGLFSVVALIGLVLIVHGYAIARTETIFLYHPPAGLRHLTALLMLLVFPLLLATYLPGRIQRTFKHPMLVATKIWAFSHLLANGSLADVLLFGSFLVWAVVDRISLKRRAPRVTPGAPEKPINDVIAVVGGLLLYGVFIMGAHKWLFGVSPFGM